MSNPNTQEEEELSERLLGWSMFLEATLDPNADESDLLHQSMRLKIADLREAVRLLEDYRTEFWRCSIPIAAHCLDPDMTDREFRQYVTNTMLGENNAR